MLANARAVHTQRWARALAERGHTITVISIRAAEIPDVTVVKRSVGNVDGAKLWALLSYLLLLIRLPFDLRRINPDVVNPHYCITHGVIAALVGARPRVVNVWGSDLIWDGARPAPWWWTFLVRYSLRGADAIISTSKFMADAVEVLMPNPPEITLVSFGVDTNHFKPPSVRPPSERIRIGFVKTFARKYAPEIFVEAAAIVARKIDNVEFCMAGRGPLLNDMRCLAKKEGLDKLINFPGFIPHEDVADFMRSLDILVNCSRYESESFGVVICEASASGLPVIVTDVGGVRETILHGETGFLVPREDAQSLAEKMLSLSRNMEMRRSMGDAGRAFIQENYEWDFCVARFERVLESVRQ